MSIEHPAKAPDPHADIHAYLDELEDIPGTRVYTAARARKGYWLNQFAMSLMKAENRDRWRADEQAYLADWPMSEEQKAGVLARDYNRLLDLGGNIYFLAKVFSTDGLSFAQAVSTMTGMNFDDYTRMMLSGGRSPEGVRSIRANEAAADAATAPAADAATAPAADAATAIADTTNGPDLAFDASKKGN